MLFSVVGIILAVIGFFSGMISGVLLHSFLYCVIVWISTFLYAIIYIGIGMILKKQDRIEIELSALKQSNEKLLHKLKNSSETEKKNAAPTPQKNEKKEQTASDKWRCVNCGKMTDQKICGFCGKESIIEGKTRCMNCGYVQDANRKVCWQCGMELK